MYSTDRGMAPIVAAPGPRRHVGTALGDVAARYNLGPVAAFAKAGRDGAGAVPFRRLALQFPDELLGDAVVVADATRRAVAAAQSCVVADVAVFVVADSTYGACCPDEVTAVHYTADCIVHFGFACFSRPSQLPCCYVTPRWAVDTAAVATACRAAVTDGATSVVVVCYPGATAAAGGDAVDDDNDDLRLRASLALALDGADGGGAATAALAGGGSQSWSDDQA